MPGRVYFASPSTALEEEERGRICRRLMAAGMLDVIGSICRRLMAAGALDVIGSI